MSKKKADKSKDNLIPEGIQNVYEGIIVCLDSGIIREVNPVVKNVLGFNPKAILGKKLHSLIHKKDKVTFTQLFQQVSSGKSKSKNLIRRIKNKNGRFLWIEGQLNRADSNNAGHVIMNFKDISEQRETSERQQEAQQGLMNSHVFLENVINTVAAPIFVKDKYHRWILFNNAFLRDRDRASVFEKSDYDFLPKPLSDKIWKVDNQVMRSGRTVVSEEVIPMGGKELRTVITTKSRFIDDKGEKFIIGFIMDITERKRFENLIKTFNSQLRAVVESTNDQVLALDRNNNYMLFNHAHAETVKQLTGKAINVGDNILEVVPKEITSTIKREVNKALRLGQFFSEIRLPNKLIFKVAYKAIKDEKGRATGVAVFAEDITDRKITEIKLRGLNEELTQQNWQLASREEELKQALDQLSERNFELDQLMYKTSHDLRSPLSSILGLVNLANLDPDQKNLQGYLGLIEGRIKRLDEFINSMLNYGRVNRGEIKVVNINIKEVLNNAIQQLENLDNYKSVRAAIKIHNEDDIPFNSDSLLVNIITSNVISNAYKYYNAEVKSYLKIKVEITPASATFCFKDNGIGIQKEHMGKIFNMFYRATDRAQGSGLGMYIVKQAVEKVNGSINIKSKYGEGTEIRIVLPNM